MRDHKQFWNQLSQNLSSYLSNGETLAVLWTMDNVLSNPHGVGFDQAKWTAILGLELGQDSGGPLLCTYCQPFHCWR